MKTSSRLMVPLAALLVGGCPARSESRSSISGVVELDSTPGLNDLSRVQVDIGRGEGATTPDETGAFSFTDLEPDNYDLTVKYAGGLTNTASKSAYKTLTLKVVAKAGGDVNLGVLSPQLGKGRLNGMLTMTDGLAVDGAEITLRDGKGVERKVVITGNSFVVEDVPVGNHRVRVQQDGYTAAQAQSPGPACGAEVTLSEDEEVVDLEDTTLAPIKAAFVEGAGNVTRTGTTWRTTDTTVSVHVLTGFAVEERHYFDGADPLPEYTAFSDAFNIDVPEGRSQLHIQFKDACGGESEVYPLNFIRDVVDPSIVSAVLNNGATYTTDNTVNLAIAASDDISTDLQMRMVQCEGGTLAAPDCPPIETASWGALATTQSVTFGADNGVKGVRLQVRDEALRVSGERTRTVMLDRAAPAGTVTIGPDTTFTRSPIVVLTLDAEGASEVAVADGPSLDCDTAVYSPFSPVQAWSFTNVDGEKSVTVCFKDHAGNTAFDSDTIILDATPPSLPRLKRNGGLTNVAASPTLELEIPSTDSGSGLAEPPYRLNLPDGGVIDWDGQPQSFTLTKGENRFRVSATDLAGNVSDDDDLVFTLDTDAPNPPHITRLVELKGDVLLEFVDANTDVRTYQVFYGGDDRATNGRYLYNGPSPIEIGTNKAVRLRGAPQGLPLFVTVRAIDEAGNTGAQTPAYRIDVDSDGFEGFSSFGGQRRRLLRGSGARVLAARGNGFEVLELPPEGSLRSLSEIPFDVNAIGVREPFAGTYFEDVVDGTTHAFAAVAVEGVGDTTSKGSVYIFDLGEARPASDPTWLRRPPPILVAVHDISGVVKDLQAISGDATRRARLAWLEAGDGSRAAVLAWLDNAPTAQPATHPFQISAPAGFDGANPMRLTSGDSGYGASYDHGVVSFALVDRDRAIVALAAEHCPNHAESCQHPDARSVVFAQLGFRASADEQDTVTYQHFSLDFPPLPDEPAGDPCPARLGIAQPPSAGDVSYFPLRRQVRVLESASTTNCGLGAWVWKPELPLFATGCAVAVRPGVDGPEIVGHFPAACDAVGLMTAAQIADNTAMIVQLNGPADALKASVSVLDTTDFSGTPVPSQEIDVERVVPSQPELSSVPAVFRANANAARAFFLRETWEGGLMMASVPTSRPLQAPTLNANVALAAPGRASDVISEQGIAYVAGGRTGIAIYDLAIPTEPRLVRTVAKDGLDAARTLHRWRNFVYAIGPDGLWILDVKDPFAPVDYDFVPEITGNLLEIGGAFALPGGGRAPTLLLHETPYAFSPSGTDTPATVVAYAIDDEPRLAGGAANPNYGKPRAGSVSAARRGVFTPFSAVGNMEQLIVHGQSLLVRGDDIYLVDLAQMSSPGDVGASDQLSGSFFSPLTVDAGRLWLLRADSNAAAGELVAFGLPGTPASPAAPAAKSPPCRQVAPCRCLDEAERLARPDVFCFRGTRNHVVTPDNQASFYVSTPDFSVDTVLSVFTDALHKTSGTLLMSPMRGPSPNEFAFDLASGDTAAMTSSLDGRDVRARGRFRFKRIVEDQGLFVAADGAAGVAVFGAPQSGNLLPLDEFSSGFSDQVPTDYRNFYRHGSVVVGHSLFLGGGLTSFFPERAHVVLIDMNQEDEPKINGIYTPADEDLGDGYAVSRGITDIALAWPYVFAAEHIGGISDNTTTLVVLDARYAPSPDEQTFDIRRWAEPPGCAPGEGGVGTFGCALRYPLTAAHLQLASGLGMHVLDLDVDGDVLVMHGEAVGAGDTKLSVSVSIAELLHAAIEQVDLAPLSEVGALGALATNGVDLRTSWGNVNAVWRESPDRTHASWRLLHAPATEHRGLDLMGQAGDPREGTVSSRGSAMLVPTDSGFVAFNQTTGGSTILGTAGGGGAMAMAFAGPTILISSSAELGSSDLPRVSALILTREVGGGWALNEVSSITGGTEHEKSGGIVDLPFGVLWSDRGLFVRLLSTSL